MATLIPDQIYASKTYADSTLGPYADLTALNGITNLFQGLTVTVLAPVPMECWLPKGKLKSSWRVKQFTSIPTYADLISYSTTIFASMKNLVDKGTEAIVVADETNDGRVTKYWVTAKDNNGLTWEKESTGIPVDGDDLENND